MQYFLYQLVKIIPLLLVAIYLLILCSRGVNIIILAKCILVVKLNIITFFFNFMT